MGIFFCWEFVMFVCYVIDVVGFFDGFIFPLGFFFFPLGVFWSLLLMLWIVKDPMSTVFLVPAILFYYSLTGFFHSSFSAISGQTPPFAIVEMGLGSLVLIWTSIMDSGVCSGFMERKRFMVLLHSKVSSINVQSREKLSQTVLNILSLQEAVLMLTATVFSYLFLGLRTFFIHICFLIKSCTLEYTKSVFCYASCSLLCNCLSLSNYIRFFWP